MKTRILVAGVLTLVAVPTASRSQDVREKEEIRKTLKFTGSEQRRIYVDNTDGAIDVVGYDGNDVELVVHREIRAESKNKIEEAKRDVTLDIKEEPSKILLYVDAPWRRSDGSINYRGYRYYGYEVTHEFELRVPKRCNLYLRTVNQGTVTVKDVEGEFEVKNVNAGIEMTNIAGPAKVSTVNGPIKISFNQNPSSESSFKTVNGKIEVEFRSGLSADLNLKTFNGQVYTDFEISDLPRQVVSTEKTRGRKRIYRRGDSFAARVGKGGPEFFFDTLNGSIYILKHD